MKVLCKVAVSCSDQILRVTGLSASEFGITWMWKWWSIEQMSQKFKCIGKSSESLACDTQVHKESGHTKTLAGFQGITEWGNITKNGVTARPGVRGRSYLGAAKDGFCITGEFFLISCYFLLTVIIHSLHSGLLVQVQRRSNCLPIQILNF